MLLRKLVIDYLLENKERVRTEVIERDLKIEMMKNKAISIVGPRRAGKTYYLFSLARKLKSFFYLDFEHLAFRKIEPEEIFDIVSIYTELYGEKPKDLFLDEVQNLENWENAVRSLIDSGYNVFISGSSSKLMSKEIATQLRGRALTYLLLPFSFKEFLRLKEMTINKYMSSVEEARVRNALSKYIFESSYPEILITKNEKLLHEYYNTILYKDFVERFGLKSMEVAKFILDFCLLNFSREFSIRKVVDFLGGYGLKFGKNTVYDYMEKLPQTLNVFFLPKLEQSIYRKPWPRKVYVCDLGLANLVGLSKDYGRRMENIVFLELLRRTNENSLMEIYYWKDGQGREVDFVVKEGLKIKQLIQVSHSSSFEEVEKREWRNLFFASKELKCNNLSIITWNYEDRLKLRWENVEKEIKFVPLWKWLLYPDKHHS